MARLSINELTTYRWTFDEDVQNYLAAGITGMGVWRQKLSDFGEERAMELLADSGLAVSSLLWAGGFTGSDGRSYRDSLDDALEALHLAADLRAAALIIYSGARAGHTHNHARRLFRGALEELAPIAGELGVTLAVEPMHAGCAAEWTFLTDLDGTLELLRGVASPHVKLALDVYHLGHDPALVQRLAELVPWIAIVQLGDAQEPPRGEQNRCQLGTGCLPLQPIVRTLLAAGYDGFFDVELLGEDVEQADYRELIAAAQRAFAELTGSGVKRRGPAPRRPLENARTVG